MKETYFFRKCVQMEKLLRGSSLWGVQTVFVARGLELSKNVVYAKREFTLEIQFMALKNLSVR